jgi:hypothetical protein
MKLFEKITNKFFRSDLAVSLDLTVTAALQDLGVVSSGTTASTFTIQSFEWKSVWVRTTA